MPDQQKAARRAHRKATGRRNPSPGSRSSDSPKTADPVVPRTPVSATVRLIQIGSLAAAIALVVVFVFSQKQTTDVRYGTNTDSGSDSVGTNPAAGGASKPSGIVPPDPELKRELAASTIVRLPGAIAGFDHDTVLAKINKADAVLAKRGDPKIHVVIAPPGISDADSDRIYALPGTNVKIIGLTVSYQGYDATPSSLGDWQGMFSDGDVTSQILSLISSDLGQPDPSGTSSVHWRAPTAAELRTVAAGVAGPGRLYVAPGASLTSVPESASDAFPATPPMVAAFPQQPLGAAIPNYAPALAKEFPNTPIIVMYGYSVSYAGPFGQDTSDVATGGFYGRYGSKIAGQAYPQWNILNVYLQQWATVRYAGLFDLPLPYTPPDPISITFPALPWVFLGCVLIFVGVSAHSVHTRRNRRPSPAASSDWNRLSGLSSLAVEVSPLADAGVANAALTRGIRRLSAAKSAIQADRHESLVGSQLDAAEREFSTVATAIGRTEYQPDHYLDRTPT